MMHKRINSIHRPNRRITTTNSHSHRLATLWLLIPETVIYSHRSAVKSMESLHRRLPCFPDCLETVSIQIDCDYIYKKTVYIELSSVIFSFVYKNNQTREIRISINNSNSKDRQKTSCCHSIRFLVARHWLSALH